MFTIIMLGCLAASDVFGASLPFALFSAGIAALDLVFSPGARGRDHLLLHKRFSSLMVAMLRCPAPDRSSIAEWKACRVEIEADEPPIYWALDKDCYNEVCYAIGKPIDLYRLTRTERWFMNFFRFERATA
jgi:hypothetical protein